MEGFDDFDQEKQAEKDSHDLGFENNYNVHGKRNLCTHSLSLLVRKLQTK